MTHYSLSIIQDGGTTFMVPLLLLILTIVILFVVALTGKKDKEKMSKLIGHISLFGMIWGLLGSTIGLITAFDSIDAVGAISQPMMAGGLKVALITTVFGLATFLIGRAAMIVLTLTSKLEPKNSHQ
jgi:hypothetical protein